MEARKILLVEDEVMTLAVMAKMLSDAGYTIAGKARTLHEALTVVQQTALDLAILDVELKGSETDGIEVANQLLNYQWIPLIFVTAYTDQETLQRMKALQPASFLSKPYRAVDLLMQVELVMQQTRKLAFSTNLLPDSMLLPENGNWVNVRKSEVVFAEAKGNFTCIFVFNRQNPFVVTDNLKNIAEHLALPSFYRLSRSLVANLTYLSHIKENQAFFRMADTASVPPKPLEIPAKSKTALLQRLPLIRAR